jgi:hypothetical protein
MFREMYVNIIFKLSLEHEMFIDLTLVCVRESVNNYAIPLCFRGKLEDGGQSSHQYVVFYLLYLILIHWLMSLEENSWS